MPYNLTTMQSIFCNNKEITEIRYNGSLVYKKQSGPDYSEPFYVENITNTNETLIISKGIFTSAPTLTIEYSTDKTTWNTLGTTSSGDLTLTLAPRDKVYLRCNTNKWCEGNYYNLINGTSKVGGNIMSLLYGSSFTGEETSFPSTDSKTLAFLFVGNNTLQDASNLLLTATTLTDSCYDSMFRNCTSLTQAPYLPATALAARCYYNMFQNCISLTTAPELPVTTLAYRCYSNMFQNCSSLTAAPALPAATVEGYCYYNMFNGCSSLTAAPALPAARLTTGCYQEMFKNCTLLNEVTCLATNNINYGDSTSSWLSGVASTGTFTKAAGSTWPSGINGIPEGWTVVEV